LDGTTAAEEGKESNQGKKEVVAGSAKFANHLLGFEYEDPK